MIWCRCQYSTILPPDIPQGSSGYARFISHIPNFAMNTWPDKLRTWLGHGSDMALRCRTAAACLCCRFPGVLDENSGQGDSTHLRGTGWTQCEKETERDGKSLQSRRRKPTMSLSLYSSISIRTKERTLTFCARRVSERENWSCGTSWFHQKDAKRWGTRTLDLVWKPYELLWLWPAKWCLCAVHHRWGATNHHICSGEGGADRTRRGAERRVSALQPCLMSEIIWKRTIRTIIKNDKNDKHGKNDKNGIRKSCFHASARHHCCSSGLQIHRVG